MHQSMAAERPRRFAALAAQAPASPAHGLKRAEAQIEQAAVERVNLSTYPKDHPIWQDLHFCPDGPEAMFPDAQEAFAAAAASLGFEVEDTEMQEGGRGTEEGGVSDEWATVAALAGTPSTAEGMKMPTMPTPSTPSVAFAMGTPVRFPGLDSMMDSPIMGSDGGKDRVRWRPEEDELIIRMRVHRDRSVNWDSIAAATGRSKQPAKNRWQYVLKKRYPDVPAGRINGI